MKTTTEVRESRANAIQSATETAAELAKAAGKLAKAIRDSKPTTGLMMDVHLLAAILETQWAKVRAFSEVLGIVGDNTETLDAMKDTGLKAMKEEVVRSVNTA